jgi:Na+-translocating ferredoxin:NAD+ oxidoreductase RnfA subunit
MENLLDQLGEFYVVKTPTVMLIGLFCGWAAYFVRARIANVAFLVVLYPLFLFISVTALCAALNGEIISIKRSQDWIIYSVAAAVIGSSVGILLVASVRKIIDVMTLNAHIRASLRRDDEDRAKGYEHNYF